jgi:hypothetical protein
VIACHFPWQDQLRFPVIADVRVSDNGSCGNADGAARLCASDWYYHHERSCEETLGEPLRLTARRRFNQDHDEYFAITLHGPRGYVVTFDAVS